MIHNRNATFYLDETNKGAVIDDLSHVQYPICTKHIKVKYDLKYKSIICYCNVHVYLNIANKKNIFHNKIVFLPELVYAPNQSLFFVNPQHT